MGGQEERREGAIVQRMRESVSEERSRQKTATGYSGLFSWENTERGGVGASQNIMVFHSHQTTLTALHKSRSQDLANISSPLLYASELNHKEANRRLAKQTKYW